jgi:hypothetical protein
MAGFSSEVKAVLGIDTSKMPEDTRKVLDSFKAAAREIEQSSAKSGSSAGSKFTDGLTSKLSNAKQLGTTLATALGVNLPNLAEKIAGAIAGGTAEGWKRSIEIAERNAEIIEKIIEAHMNPTQLEAKQRRDLQRAMSENQTSPVSSTTIKRKVVSSMIGIPGLDKMLASMGIGQTEADIAEERAKRTLKVNEADLRVTLSEKDTREQLKKLEEDSLNAKERHGTLSEKEQAIRENIKKLELSIVNDDMTQVELKKKENELAEKRAALEENLKDQKKEVLELEKTDIALAEKRNELAHQRKELEKDQAKLKDRGKLTVGELAAIRSNPESERERLARRDAEDRARAFAFGADGDLSSEARAAKDKAIQVRRLEEDAESARLGGDSQKSLEILAQVGSLRDELVRSGYTKSTEGDPARELKEQIAKDNEQIIKTLNDIATTEKGKYINQ